MKKTSYRITIASPCHEEWNTMLPEEKGKFCGACQKKVVDFSVMSDDEIAKLIHSKSAVCGRFLNSQLDRTIAQTVPYQNSVSFWKSAILFIWTLFLFRQPAIAQVKQIPHTEQLNPTMGKPIYHPTNNHPKLILRGVVRDSSNNMPIPWAIMIVYHNQNEIYKAVTDSTGHFRIAVRYSKGISLESNVLGYESTIITHITHSRKDMVFKMKASNDFEIDTMPYTTTGLMIAEPDTAQQKK